MTPKIACPKCHGYDSKVINTRPTVQGVYRRRECLDCGRKYSTLETYHRYPSTKFQPDHKV